MDQDYDYDGSISEVRIWNKVLSDQEIMDHFCDSIVASHPSYANLIGYWKMNEGSGNQVIDQTTNGNNGTINGASWYTPDSIWTYDYSNTPRVVDISINALGHLCIPIEASWNLDGKAWLPDCEYDDINCVNPGYNTWIGPANGLWSVNENWSRLFSPIPCDNVVIPNANVVTILNGELEECKTLKIETGGELNIDLGAELKVTDD